MATATGHRARPRRWPKAAVLALSFATQGCLVAAAAAAAGGGGLPPGWTVHYHQNRPYFHNEDTGETTWDPPPTKTGSHNARGSSNVRVNSQMRPQQQQQQQHPHPGYESAESNRNSRAAAAARGKLMSAEERFSDRSPASAPGGNNKKRTWFGLRRNKTAAGQSQLQVSQQQKGITPQERWEDRWQEIGPGRRDGGGGDGGDERRLDRAGQVVREYNHLPAATPSAAGRTADFQSTEGFRGEYQPRQPPPPPQQQQQQQQQRGGVRQDEQDGAFYRYDRMRRPATEGNGGGRGRESVSGAARPWDPYAGMMAYATPPSADYLESSEANADAMAIDTAEEEKGKVRTPEGGGRWWVAAGDASTPGMTGTTAALMAPTAVVDGSAPPIDGDGDCDSRQDGHADGRTSPRQELQGQSAGGEEGTVGNETSAGETEVDLEASGGMSGGEVPPPASGAASTEQHGQPNLMTNKGWFSPPAPPAAAATGVLKEKEENTTPTSATATTMLNSPITAAAAAAPAADSVTAGTGGRGGQAAVAAADANKDDAAPMFNGSVGGEAGGSGGGGDSFAASGATAAGVGDGVDPTMMMADVFYGVPQDQQLGEKGVELPPGWRQQGSGGGLGLGYSEGQLQQQQHQGQGGQQPAQQEQAPQAFEWDWEESWGQAAPWSGTGWTAPPSPGGSLEFPARDGCGSSAVAPPPLQQHGEAPANMWGFQSASEGVGGGGAGGVGIAQSGDELQKHTREEAEKALADAWRELEGSKKMEEELRAALREQEEARLAAEAVSAAVKEKAAREATVAAKELGRERQYLAVSVGCLLPVGAELETTRRRLETVESNSTTLEVKVATYENTAKEAQERADTAETKLKGALEDVEMLDECLKQYMDGDGGARDRPSPLSWRRFSDAYLLPLLPSKLKAPSPAELEVVKVNRSLARALENNTALVEAVSSKDDLIKDLNSRIKQFQLHAVRRKKGYRALKVGLAELTDEVQAKESMMVTLAVCMYGTYSTALAAQQADLTVMAARVRDRDESAVAITAQLADRDSHVKELRESLAQVVDALLAVTASFGIREDCIQQWNDGVEAGDTDATPALINEIHSAAAKMSLSPLGLESSTGALTVAIPRAMVAPTPSGPSRGDESVKSADRGRTSVGFWASAANVLCCRRGSGRS